MRTDQERIEDLEEEVERLILIWVQVNNSLTQAMLAAASSEEAKAVLDGGEG
jgi:hypothetical protein